MSINRNSRDAAAPGPLTHGQALHAPEARRLKPITKPKVLIVEGKDEELLFSKLIDHLELQDIEIWDIGGKTKIR